MENPIVEVYWLDAAFTLDLEHDDLVRWQENGGEKAKTVGYLYEKADDYVIVASEVFEDGTYRGLTIIPMGMITRIDYVTRVPVIVEESNE